MAKISQQKAGVLLSYLNLALGSIVPILYTPIMLGILGQAEYGLVGLSQSVTSYLTLLNLGLSAAIGRYLAKYRAEGNVDATQRLIGMFVTLYSCAAVLVCCIGGGLAFFSDKLFAKGLAAWEIDRLRVLVVIMTLSVAISLPVSTFSAVINIYERFVFLQVISIVGTVGGPALNLVALFWGYGSVGMALLGLLLQASFGFLYIFYCAKKLRLRPCFRKMPFYLLKELAGFCFFVVLATIVDMLYWSTDKVLIGAVLGSVAVAVYNIGGVFTAILQNLAHAISQVFTPKIMMIATKDEQTSDEISEILIRIGRLQFYVVSFIISGYVVFGQRFVRIWAGEDYGASYYVALLTLVPLAVPLIQSVAYSTIMAKNKHRFRAVVYAVIAVANVVATYLVLPYWGIIGAAACTAVAFVLGNGIVMNIYYYRVIKLNIPRFWKNIISILPVPLVMTAVGWLVSNLLLKTDAIWVFLIGVALYSVVFWLLFWFTSMNKYEKELILGLLRRKGKQEI